MKKKSQNKKQNGETSTSTQHNTSRPLEKNLLKEHYSKAETIEPEEPFEWNDIGDGFYAVGKKDGPFTLTLGNNACSGRSFKSTKEAKDYKDSKPWELILITSDIYHKLVNQTIEKAKKGV